MKKTLLYCLAGVIMVTLMFSTGCRSTLRTKTIYQGDWAVTKMKVHKRPKYRLRKKAINSRMFNQPGPLKF